MPTTTICAIPVLWEAPAQHESRKLVIWLPGFTDSKESVLPYPQALATNGNVALSFDPIDHGKCSRTEGQDISDPASGSLRDPRTGKVYRLFWSILVAQFAPLVSALLISIPAEVNRTAFKRTIWPVSSAPCRTISQHQIAVSPASAALKLSTHDTPRHSS